MSRPNLDIPGKTELRALYQSYAPVYETSLLHLQQEIHRLLEQHHFSPTIKYRVKRFDAYYQKLRKLGEGHALHQGAITDFIGVRIICPFLSDIETVEQLLTDHLDVLEVERKAGQHSFREFGYDSVHLLVNHSLENLPQCLPGVPSVCEIQLRTILQDAWAEVEHELVYKSDIDLPNESIRRKLASLNATLTLSDLIFQEIRDFQQELRQRGRRRRDSVKRDLDRPEILPMEGSVTPFQQQSLRLGPVPKTLTSVLEKLMLLALEAHSNHDFETAIEHYGKLLGMKLKKKIRALIYNHRGMAYFALGQTRLALKDFTKAVSYDPTSTNGYANRGLCHRVLRQYEQALADFNRVLELDSEHDEGYYGRAQCYYELGLHDQALNDCRLLLQRQPEFAAAKQLQKLIHRSML